MTILLAWLLADLLSGIFHWWEDRVLLTPSPVKFIETIRIENEMHHMRPYEMVRNSAWGNIRSTVVVVWPLALALFLAGVPTVIWLAVFFTAFGNLIHRWGHIPRRRLNPVIKMMQSTGLFISHTHHHWHHYDSQSRVDKVDSRIRYCPMTSWLNPILDRVKFFGFLEYIF